MVDDETNETWLTTDPDEVKSWARDARAVPVRESGTVTFVDEGEFDEDRHDRIEWPAFGEALSETDGVVIFRGEEERPAIEIRNREDVRAALDDDAHRQLDEGQVLSRPTDEIGTTTAEHEAMTPERVRPTEDDEGKTVVDTEGAELGVVKTVEGSQLYVDPQPSLIESVLSRIGWGDADESDYVLGPDEIVLINEDRVEVKTPR